MNEQTSQKAQAVAEINPIITELAAFEDTIDQIDVADEETQAQVGDLVKLLSSRRAKIEAKRKSLTKPLNDVVKEINALFKVPIERIDIVIRIAKDKMSRFSQAMIAIEEAKKRQEEEEARREREESAALAASLAEKAGTTGAEVGAALVDQAQEKVEKAEKKVAKVEVNRGQASSVITTTTWHAAVVDMMAIVKAVAEGRLDPEVLEVNMAALTRISRATKLEREVDGVRYFKKIGTQVR